MRVLIYYIDFHWDNHQGGSGKSFEMRFSLDIPAETTAAEFKNYVVRNLENHIAEQRPFQQREKASIIKIEVI